MAHSRHSILRAKDKTMLRKMRCFAFGLLICLPSMMSVPARAAELVREPAVAGSFYEANPERLAKDVSSFLTRADQDPLEGKLLGLICPHAGYPYC